MARSSRPSVCRRSASRGWSAASRASAAARRSSWHSPPRSSSFCSFVLPTSSRISKTTARYRPYRPVPRGLVTLGELGWIGVGGAAIQLALALWLHPPLVALLVLAWAYLALMSREFFVAEWLRRRPAIYMASHMVIIPLIDLYATACDWLLVTGWPPTGPDLVSAGQLCQRDRRRGRAQDASACGRGAGRRDLFSGVGTDDRRRPSGSRHSS